MTKFFKLTGVSILAIMATANANAAGYTCEELIEYTSCNAGYALTDGDCIRLCDAGYYLNGDTCSICPVGTYSLRGSSSCAKCPLTDLKDSSGTVVAATTEKSGSTSAAACVIPTNVEFKDEMGIYHFKSSCAHDEKLTFKEACEADPYGIYSEDLENDHIECDCSALWESFTASSDYIVEFAYSAELGRGYCVTDYTERQLVYNNCVAPDTGGTWNWDTRSCDCGDGIEWAFSDVYTMYVCIRDESICQEYMNGTWQDGKCIR